MKTTHAVAAASGRRRKHALDANSREIRQSHRNAAQDPFRG